MIAFRPAEPRDRALIVDAWSESYRTAYTSGLIQMEDWKDIMPGQIGKMLDKAQCIVAHVPDDPDPIADLLGFIVYDTANFQHPYVYYVYVKANFRRAGYRDGHRIGDGIGRRLFKAAGINPAGRFNYAASTRKQRELLQKVPLARHVPLLARFSLEAARRHDAEQRW